MRQKSSEPTERWRSAFIQVSESKRLRVFELPENFCFNTDDPLSDANPDMDTTEIFQQLNRAYEVLKDDDLRFQFDKFGSDGIKNSYSSDSTVRSYNVKKPDEVYYHSEANPFSPLHGTTYYQYPPQSRPDVGHGARPHFHNSQSPPPHNDGVPNGRRPYREESWDPWKSTFADIYDAQIRNGDYYAYDPYAPLDTSSFKGRDPSFGFGNINTSHQKVGPDFQHTHGMPRYARSNGNINTGHQNVHAGGPANRSSQGPRRQTIGETMNFHDTHSSSTRSSGSGSRRRWVGEDICIEMEIDYEKALKGGEEKIRIKRLEACSTCDGDGIHPGAKIETCKHCGGSGAILHKAAPVGMSATDNFSGHKVCHHCRGTGQTVAENCGTCHGRGIKQTSKEMTLVIPPGVTDKSKLRLKGEGDVGPLNGPAGDLFVFLKVKQDRSHSVY